MRKVLLTVVFIIGQMIFICLIIKICKINDQGDIEYGQLRILNERNGISIRPKINKKFTSQKIRFTPKNPIWEQINEDIFFKRSSAFYVIERSLLRIYFIRKKEIKYQLDFRIEIKLSFEETHHLFFKNVSIKSYGGFGLYEWNSLSYNFDLLRLLKKDSYDDILNNDYKFQLYISNSNNTLEETLFPIDVTLKYIRSRPSKEKKGSIVCSKCFWLKQTDYQDLFWWIELNRQAGYKKIVFCNNSIPNTKEFNDLFENLLKILLDLRFY